MIAYPIPVPEGTPAWVGVLFVLAATAGFVVLVWQTVRYFRGGGRGPGGAGAGPGAGPGDGA